jgi:hypothetical protein
MPEGAPSGEPAKKQCRIRTIKNAARREISLYAGMPGPQTGFDLYPAGVSQVHPPLGAMHVKFL